ncbi:hypothetical protein ACFW9M_14170 [Streptomyces lydicus]|uniref:hypothetical protein n=1 Tax=Streptomyces lydicus TaxID=47763 RepID=UPI0036AA0D76
MRSMRRVGPAAVAAVGFVLLAGCGGGGEADAKPPHPTVRSSDAAPTQTAEPTAEPTQDPFPDTPAGDLDRKAEKAGWEVDSLYDAPSDYVDDICESMPEQQKLGQDPGEWLMTAQEPDEDETAVLRAGMSKLCPKWWPVTRKALAGDFVHTYTDGTYEVKAKPKDSPDQPADRFRAGRAPPPPRPPAQPVTAAATSFNAGWPLGVRRGLGRPSAGWSWR